MGETILAPMQAPGAETQQASFLRQALLTFVLASLVGAFFQANPGFLDFGQGEQWFSQRSPGLPEGDSGYHIRMAWLYRTGEAQAAGKDFHWTRISIWNGRFSDKDYLYHIYLIPFTVFAQDAYDHDGLVKGAKLGASVVWGIVALSVLCALRLLGVRRAWPCVLLIAATSWLFMLRLGEARSWGFSAACALVGWACILRGNRAAVFCIGVVYTLAYTASHILLLLAVFHLLARLVLGPDPGGTRKADLLHNASMVGLAALGILVGALLHPQPFELMRLWWIQNVLVLYMHSGGGIEGTIGNITQNLLGWERVPRNLQLPRQMFGGELHPLAPEALLSGFGLALALPLILGAGAFACRWRPDRRAIMTMLIACGLLALIARSLRFSEYALSFLALTAGVWASGMARFGRVPSWLAADQRRVWADRAMTGALAVAAMAQALYLRHAIPVLPYSRQPAMLAWLETSREVKGKMIYNISWDAFPELFLVRSDCDYAAGLDPAFVAAAGTRPSQVYINLAMGRVEYVASDGPSLVRVMRDEIGADYIFIQRDRNAVMYDGLKQMADNRLLQTAFLDEESQAAMYRIPR